MTNNTEYIFNRLLDMINDCKKQVFDHRLKQTKDRLEIWRKIEEVGNIVKMMNDDLQKMRRVVFYLIVSNVLAWVVIIIRSL